jgi:hypothetical protein
MKLLPLFRCDNTTPHNARYEMSAREMDIVLALLETE